ncbi:MAG: hypothetical protein KDK65_03790 [Chlamydiia bacterium]|nr:hypothetical protein [Chlamydiia bacterium]
MNKLKMYEEAAETATAPPPMGDIPKQWVPGWIRWPIRLLFLPFVWLDLAAKQIARWIIPPPYKQAGHCNKRGNCCHYVLVGKRAGFLGYLELFWNTQINGFFIRDTVTVDDTKILVLGCRYLSPKGTCAHHTLRPVICREWPRIEHFGHPQILKGCGYRTIKR